MTSRCRRRPYLRSSSLITNCPYRSLARLPPISIRCTCATWTCCHNTASLAKPVWCDTLDNISASPIYYRLSRYFDVTSIILCSRCMDGCYVVADLGTFSVFGQTGTRPHKEGEINRKMSETAQHFFWSVHESLCDTLRN